MTKVHDEATITKTAEDEEEDHCEGPSTMHWGLVLTVSLVTVVYALLGGIIFRTIELPHEQEQFQAAVVYYNETLKAMNYSSDGQLLKVIKHFERRILPYAVITDKGLEPKDDWNMFGAIMFATTIISTVGYGNIVPKTLLGRWITVLYGIIGIPLFVFTMAGLASKMYGLMYALPTHCKRSGCLRFGNIKNWVLTTYTVVGTILFFLLPTLVFAHTEQWDFNESFYFSFVTLSTIGFGDFVPHQLPGTSSAYLISVVLYIGLGLAWLSGLVAAASEWWSARYTHAYNHVRDRVRTRIDTLRNGVPETKISDNEQQPETSSNRTTETADQIITPL